MISSEVPQDPYPCSILQDLFVLAAYLNPPFYLLHFKVFLIFRLMLEAFIKLYKRFNIFNRREGYLFNRIAKGKLESLECFPLQSLYL